MTTRTIGSIKVNNFDDFNSLMKRLENDERVGAMTIRSENKSVQIKIGVGMDVKLNHKFEKFENIMDDYSDIAIKGVVIGSNDTDNYGMARYYEVKNNSIVTVDEYTESIEDEERYWGEKSAAIMFSKYDINANTHMFAPGAEEYDGQEFIKSK